MVSVRAPDTLLRPSPLQLKEVTPEGSGSLTATAVAALGTALLTTTVYVVLVPGTTEVTPSVLVTPTSYCGVSVSVSVLLLLPGTVSVTPLGGDTVAVLLREPVSVGLMARVSWK